MIVSSYQIPLFENYNHKVLLIVDVQEAFEKFFPCDYVKKLESYAEQFSHVYQIWDDTQASKPSYDFPNEVDTVKKTYGGEPNEEELKRFTDESRERFLEGEEVGYEGVYFYKDGGALFYIGMGGGGSPGHEWFSVDSKYMDLLEELKVQSTTIVLVGGGMWECLYDVEVTLQEMNIKYEYDYDFTYDANSGCET